MLLQSFTKKCKHFFVSFLTPNLATFALQKYRRCKSESQQNKYSSDELYLFWRREQDSNLR